MTRHHQKTPFTTKKEISARENSKNKAKGFSGGASGRVRPQALGLSLHGSAAITLEIGSRFFVNGSQDSEKIYFVAILAGDEGFEPPITGPEPVALPLGQSPLCCFIFP